MLEIFPLLIPILALTIPCLAIWTKHQSKMAELQLRMRADEQQVRNGDLATSDAYARLEERVRVLERIVTDRGSDLAAQIDALRAESPALQAQRPDLLQSTKVPS
ncbi:hypothetical protein [Novosphingobium sp.]|uniref:hypothetical protein n=1 Tax=Novosphingobium sp. TaxID=1874826 RepID=UPI002625A963|nr:hypothetical protein [Novosphingobium sp.]